VLLLEAEDPRKRWAEGMHFDDKERWKDYRKRGEIAFTFSTQLAGVEWCLCEEYRSSVLELSMACISRDEPWR
jgi:hypothetical protein